MNLFSFWQNITFLLSSVFLVECSLLGLGDFEPMQCIPGEQDYKCDDKNMDEGIDLSTDCRIFQCSKEGVGCEKRERDLDNDGYSDKTLCFREDAGQNKDSELFDCRDDADDIHEGAEEKCDALDNDCDGYIDEGRQIIEILGFHDTVVRSFFTEYFNNRSAVPIELLISGNQPSDLIAVVQDGFGMVTRLTSDPNGILAAWKPGNTNPFDTTSSKPECDVFFEDGNYNKYKCDIYHLGFSQVGQNIITASVFIGAVAKGQLKIGFIDTHNSHLNIEEVGFQYNISDSTGVRYPVIMGLDMSISGLKRQAMVQWLDDNHENPKLQSCSENGEPNIYVSLKALGLYFDEKITTALDKKSDIEVSTTHGGIPIEIGKTTNTTTSLIRRPGKNSNGVISVFRNQNLMMEFALFDPFLDGENDGSILEKARCQQDTLGDGIERFAVAAGNPNSEDEDNSSMMVAYQTGCTPNATIGLAFYKLKVSEMEDCSLYFSSSEVYPNISGPGVQIVDGPAIGYGVVANEILEETSKEPSTQIWGWIVIWIERHSSKYFLKGIRVSVAEGELFFLDDKPFELFSDDKLVSPVVLTKDDGTLFISVVKSNGLPIWGRIVCQPPGEREEKNAANSQPNSN